MMPNKIGIYKITSPTNRVYIGQSIHILKRKLDYSRYAKYGGQRRLKASVNKYGWDSHDFAIIEECEPAVLNDRERYWQDYYHAAGIKGLNCKLTKSCDKSGELGVLIKRRISLALTGQKKSDASKLKMKNAQLGKKRSSQHKLNMSLSHKAHYKNNPDRTKKQGSYRHREIEQYSINGRLINSFKSMREAARQTKTDIASIHNCCNGLKYYKSANNFAWKYKTECR